MLKIKWWEWRLLPEENGLDFSFPEEAVELIESLIESKKLSVFLPKKYTVRSLGSDGFSIQKNPD